MEIQLSWQPLRFISPPCTAPPGFLVSTLELSNPDLLSDYYISVLLIYDLQKLSSRPTEQAEAAGPADHEQPATRLMSALQELLVHYPSAAGLLVHNETDGRLEVRYPLPLPPYSAPNGHVQAALSEVPPRPRTLESNGAAPNAHMFGVQFHVAHANLALSDLGDVSDPQPCMDVLYPIMVHPDIQACGSNGDGLSSPARRIMAFQLTTFECGGFCLAHTCNHVYFDGYSASIFLKNLCSIARGQGLANPPDFSISRRVALSPRDPPSPTIPCPAIGARACGNPPPSALPKHLNHGTAKRFVFPMDALKDLRKHASKPGESKSCSRMQALMALLWTAFAKVRLEVQGHPASDEMPLRFPINLRARGISKLSANYMGNAVYNGTCTATLKELCESPLWHTVGKLNIVMGSLDLIAEAYQSCIDEIELKMREGLVPFIQEEAMGIPSLVSLPFYDTDCGWGCPIYVACPSQQLRNICAVLDHPTVGAWNVLAVFASEEERACFQKSIANYIVITKK